MKKTIKWGSAFISLLLCTILVEKATAQDMQIGEVRGGLGLTCTRPDVSNSASLNSYSHGKLECGFSAIAEAAAFETASIELGLFYNEYQFVRVMAGELTDENVRRIHIPLLFKFWILNSVYLGVGAYASYRVGSVSSPNGLMADENLRTSAYDTGEHGMETSLGGEWGLFEKKIFVRAEYRHSYSLTPRPNEARNYNGILVAILWPIAVKL